MVRTGGDQPRCCTDGVCSAIGIRDADDRRRGIRCHHPPGTPAAMAPLRLPGRRGAAMGALCVLLMCCAAADPGKDAGSAPAEKAERAAALSSAAAPTAAAAAELAVTAAAYNPRKVDWRALVDACLQIGKHERRMAGMIIRTGYHDAMTVDTKCLDKQPANPITCGGADGSALLVLSEQKRNESQHRSYIKRTAAVLLPLARRFGASAADTLAVCGMALTAAVGAPNMLDLAVLRVGRRDRAVANPEGVLLPGEADLAALDAYWRARRMTLDEGIALQGIHALMENKGCMSPRASAARRAAAAAHGGARRLQHTYEKGPDIKTCNPYGRNVTNAEGRTPVAGSCKNLAMFKLDNQFYLDLCTPTVSMFDFELDVGLKDLPEDIWKINLIDITCSFSSDSFRRVAIREAVDERSGDVSHWPETGWLTHNTTGVYWSTNGCTSTARGRARANCKHMVYWPYTRLDGHMAMACQNPAATGNRALASRVGRSVQEYMNNLRSWYIDYGKAFAKMMSVFADWAPESFYPTFTECASYVKAGSKDAAPCAACRPPTRFETNEAAAAEALAARRNATAPAGCPADCVCASTIAPSELDWKKIACGNVCP